MSRRPLIALSSLGCVLGLLAPVSAARADPPDTCTFIPPARIAIYATTTTQPARISGACRPDGNGTWTTFGAYEHSARASFDAYYGPKTPTIVTPDALALYGRQLWDGSATKDATIFCGDNPPCPQIPANKPHSDIRLGGYVSLTAARSGSRVVLTAGSGGWSPYSHKPVPRPGIAGEIQTLYADGTWHRIGNPFTTGTNAKATVVITSPGARTYRYAMYSTASYFERASAPITR